MEPVASPPLAIGRRVAVVAPGAPQPDDARIALVVPRGAFGSGEHETTAACLEVLEAHPAVAGARVLDLGSGTGILGVAAVLLGARSATCVDIAAGAVEVSRRTAEVNGVAERVRCVHGELAAAGREPFDLAVANLYADVLISVAPRLVAAVVPGAPLLLSGLAWEQAFEVRTRYEQLGCRTVGSRWGDEWVTLELAAPGPGSPSRFPSVRAPYHRAGGEP